MEKLDRIYRLHRVLNNRRTPISRIDLQSSLDCSRSTLTRVLRDCRDNLGFPIEYDQDRQGYYLDRKQGDAYELPGLWFSAAEIYALLTSHQLLTKLKPGLFEPYINPLKDRLEALLKHRHAGDREVFHRIRILPMAPREIRLAEFQRVTDALVTRKRLRIKYSSRSKEELTERWISPQRLVFYRDNWYLDAWCHWKNNLRTFSIDRMNVAEVDTDVIDIGDRDLDRYFTETYGIFAGPVTNQAVIRFSAHAARWVADQQWHPDQTSRALPDGGWEITVPYGDPRELVMDVLKYGPDAEVVAPKALRNLVRKMLKQSLASYEN